MMVYFGLLGILVMHRKKINESTGCGYEVSGIILLQELVVVKTCLCMFQLA